MHRSSPHSEISKSIRSASTFFTATKNIVISSDKKTRRATSPALVVFGRILQLFGGNGLALAASRAEAL